MSIELSNNAVIESSIDIHSFITICIAHCVQSVESETLEAVARWSVICKVVSF